MTSAPERKSRYLWVAGAAAALAAGWALLAGAAALTAAAGPAAAPTAAPSVPAAAASGVAAVSARIAGSRPEDFRTTPVAGIYEYRHGAEIIYVTEDGRFAFTGDLFSMAERVNITEARRKELRQQLLAGVPESSMVVFPAGKPKYTVTVFTDVDCIYCRKLHSQIGEYNRLGITVRYLAFPRNGPGTESWSKAQQVWCSADRRSALTRAKLGEKLPAARCDDPVAREFALGQAMGIEGTPGILTPNGDLLPGYLPPEALLGELQGPARG